jgi:hypothetical protein
MFGSVVRTATEHDALCPGASAFEVEIAYFALGPPVPPTGVIEMPACAHAALGVNVYGPM